MTRRLSSALAGVATLASAGALILVGAAAAIAAPPTFEPDPNSIGNVWLYDASGAPVTSGSNTASPITAFALGTAAGHVIGDNKATLFLCTPQEGQNTADWPCEQLSSSSTYPNASAPGELGTTSMPLATNADGDETVAQAIAAFPNTTTTSPGIYQLRVYTSGLGQSQGATYDRADISVNTVAGTWTQVHPTYSATTTTVSSDQPSPQPPGTTIALTATVSDNATGTVEFFDGATSLGAPQAVPGSGSGNNKVTVNQTPALGTHSYKAVYTPSLANGFSGSQSTPLSFVIKVPPMSTTTTLSATSATGKGFDPANLTATVVGADSTHPSGTVAFKEGSKTLGTRSTQTPAGSGIYKFTTSALGPGDHTLKAAFTPADPSSYNSSTSLGVTLHLARIKTAISQQPVSVSGAVLGLGPQFKATLTKSSTSAGISGKTIRFAVAGKTVCSGKTNATGVATCSGPVGATVSLLLARASTAIFDGDTTYLAVQVTTPIVL